MKVLVACEESQAVCIEFRKLGHEAFSCDIQECSGGHPEWHIQDDVIKVIGGGYWDMMIAFPPCTHLAVSGAKHFEQKRKDGRQQEGIDFFMAMVNAPIERIAIENPMGIMSTFYRKPDQIIQPYFFGDEAQKTTCLWLKNLPALYHNSAPNLFDTDVTHVGKGEFYITPTGKKMPKWMCDPVGADGKKMAYGTDEIKKLRSKTFPGIAKAMASQWGNLKEVAA
ncbi:MAG: hypothetical protein K0S09_48 [Sphingobacteriaceae bacterium]|jgi:hypothetical protein|nr:hypothetical protein [Sphingobacteriaceae bacterium]